MYFLPMVLGWMGTEGCQCTPILPSTEPPPPPPPTGDTSQTGDTGPEPPCAWPEIEPNNSVLEPTFLGMEQRGCGLVNEPLDSDWWAFTLDDDGWIEVEVDAANGAISNMTFLLNTVGDSWSASRFDDPESFDATLRFLAPAGDYLLQTSEQDFGGGERYGYDVLVSEAKSPITWTRNELEPNDNLAAAETVIGGEEIYGTMAGNGALGDQDWYVLTVPVNKHVVSIDVEAFDYGSAADLTVYLYDLNLEKLPSGCDEEPCSGSGCCAMEGGAAGIEFDPIGTYDSPGAEYVYIQVIEMLNRESPANWYVLKIGLEEG